MDEMMMKCGSRLGGFMELLGFHQQYFIPPPPPPNFSSSSSISSTTNNNSSPISIFDHHHHHHHQGPNDLLSLPQDHDQYPFKDHQLNYNVIYNQQQQQQPQPQPQPATPNSSTISSESSDEVCHDDQHTRPLDDTHDEPPPRHHPYNTIQKLKVKKSNEMKNSKGVQRKQKRQQNKEARVAFMTRSEVDHLEDGFRWRKYGQKAVKNSPFPRSYYRCTNPTCNVKKRVERSLNDPTVVVTTYEGKHTHPSPILMHHHHHPSLATLPPPFTTSGFASPPQITIPQNHLQIFPHFGNLHPLINDVGKNNNMLISTSTHDHGLLQDIVPFLEKKDQ